MDWEEVVLRNERRELEEEQIDDGGEGEMFIVVKTKKSYDHTRILDNKTHHNIYRPNFFMSPVRLHSSPPLRRLIALDRIGLPISFYPTFHDQISFFLLFFDR